MKLLVLLACLILSQGLLAVTHSSWQQMSFEQKEYMVHHNNNEWFLKSYTFTIVGNRAFNEDMKAIPMVPWYQRIHATPSSLYFDETDDQFNWEGRYGIVGLPRYTYTLFYSSDNKFLYFERETFIEGCEDGQRVKPFGGQHFRDWGHARMFGCVETDISWTGRESFLDDGARVNRYSEDYLEWTGY